MGRTMHYSERGDRSGELVPSFKFPPGIGTMCILPLLHWAELLRFRAYSHARSVTLGRVKKVRFTAFYAIRGIETRQKCRRYSLGRFESSASHSTPLHRLALRYVGWSPRWPRGRLFQVPDSPASSRIRARFLELTICSK
jgi:hypothetical protein